MARLSRRKDASRWPRMSSTFWAVLLLTALLLLYCALDCSAFNSSEQKAQFQRLADRLTNSSLSMNNSRLEPYTPSDDTNKGQLQS